MNEAQPTTFYLMRHGETEAKKAGLVCGVTDSPLTPEGRDQVVVIGAKHQEVPLDRVVESGLIRSTQSREAFVEGYGRELPVDVVPQLREINYGEYDGRPAEDYAAAKKEFFGANPEVDGLAVGVGEGAESYREAADRFYAGLLSLAQQYPGMKILVPNHSGNIRSLFFTGKIITEAGAPDFGKDLSFGEMVTLRSDGERIWHVSKE